MILSIITNVGLICVHATDDDVLDKISQLQALGHNVEVHMS